MPSSLPPHTSAVALPAALLRGLTLAALVAAASFAAARLGLAMDPRQVSMGLAWLPAGVALAVFVRCGPSVWPGLVLGTWLATRGAGGAPWLAETVAAGSLLGALVGATWLRQRDFAPQLKTAHDITLLLVAAALGALVSGATVALWWALGPAVQTDRWPQAALASTLSHALGTLSVAVPLLSLGRDTWRDAFVASRWGLPVLAAAAALASALAGLLWQSHLPPSLAWLGFVPHIVLCLLTWRFGLAISSLLGLTATLGAVSLVVASTSASAMAGLPAPPPWALQSYAASLTLTLLLFATLVGELMRREERWRLALEGSELGVADWDLRKGQGVVSTRWRAIVGDQGKVGGATLAGWLESVHEDDRPMLQQAIDALGQPGHDHLRHDVRLQTPRGWAWLEAILTVASRDAQGRPARLIAALSNVDERRVAAERQRLSVSLFQHLHEGLLITDAQFRVLDVNPTYSEILGMARQDLLGQVPAMLRTGPQQDAMWASLHASGTWRGEITERRRNGDPCALHLTISAVRGSDSEVQYHVLVISDITEQRLQRERLEQQAHFDELTRLPNRTRMSQMLADAMAASEREGYLLTVCYLDLDHLKLVNDRHGHAAGDRLLVELSQRLRGALRSNMTWADTAARLGGDEFVLLLRAQTLAEARLAVERVLRVLAKPYVIDANQDAVQVTASVGATVYPLDRSDADTLLRHADHAMYSAKQSGRNGYLFFDPEHSRRTEERVLAIGRVQEALDQRELLLYYQPKVDMRRGVVLGVEALLRWNHPDQGIILPAQFLPLIEHTGLSAQVGDWVLEQALDQLAHWHRMGLTLSVSVNVSARHLQEDDFAQRLAELLARQKRPLGQSLELEILETAALADIGYTSDLLDHCRKLGVRFALDDFGTGYSTLTYLKRLPVDALKVDRSFVHNMLEDRQDLAIVEGVISLARTFGCEVVAEGVETPAQARLLIEMGCDIGQGMGIAAPMPASEVFQWVNEYRGPFALAQAIPPARALGQTVE